MAFEVAAITSSWSDGGIGTECPRGRYSTPCSRVFVLLAVTGVLAGRRRLPQTTDTDGLPRGRSVAAHAPAGRRPISSSLLFTRDVGLAPRAVVGRRRRHRHRLGAAAESTCDSTAADTEVNEDTVEDLRLIRALCTRRFSAGSIAVHARLPLEIETGGRCRRRRGASVPTIRRAGRGRARTRTRSRRLDVGILVETVEALLRASAPGSPVSRVFVGLNDLAIERHSPSSSRRSLTEQWRGSDPPSSAPSGLRGADRSTTRGTRSRAGS